MKTLKPFVYGNKTLETRAYSGEVIGYNAVVKTHVSGGGGGYNNNYSAPVTSSHEVIQQFFLKEDGTNQEHPFTFNNKEIPLRDGQKVTIISINDGRNNLSARIVNHNAKRYWQTRTAAQLNMQFKVVQGKLGISLVGGTLAWLIIGGITNLMGVLWFPMFALTIGYCALRISSLKRLHKKLDEHLDALSQEAFRSY